MQKIGCLLLYALAGVLFALGLVIGDAYNNYTDLTKKALEKKKNVVTKQFHIYNVTETNDKETKKYLDTTEGIRIIVKKEDDIFWTYRVGDEISVTYGRADESDKSIYNYKITSLISSGNDYKSTDYKSTEQTKTLEWKHFQKNIDK